MPRSGSKDRALTFLLSCFAEAFEGRKGDIDYKAIAGFLSEQSIFDIKTKDKKKDQDIRPEDIEKRINRIKREDINIGNVLALLGLFMDVGFQAQKREQLYQILKEKDFTITKSH